LWTKSLFVMSTFRILRPSSGLSTLAEMTALPSPASTRYWAKEAKALKWTLSKLTGMAWSPWVRSLPILQENGGRLQKHALRGDERKEKEKRVEDAGPPPSLLSDGLEAAAPGSGGETVHIDMA
jgi:hypothetical protein